MLTRYDEFPVHQSSYPFSEIPSTDYAWDDGYFFGVYNAEERLFLFSGLRVNPNSDMIGGYGAVMLDGRQYTVRVARPWRQDCDTHAGPLRYNFLEPFRDIHLSLAEHGSELAFDLHWLGLAPAYEEEHHLAWSRGRRTTDQTRYSQCGTASGWISFAGKLYEVRPHEWWGARDHSWGIYMERPPLTPDRRWLPPAEAPAVRRALRLWVLFQTPEYSGFYHLHEDENGNQLRMNDVFGTPFDGGIDFGWEKPRLRLVAGRHEIEFIPGSRAPRRLRVFLEDEHGGQWLQEMEIRTPGWHPFTIGYAKGSWKDGGTMVTYRGADAPAVEWDDFDFSPQPVDHTTYDGTVIRGMSAPESLAHVRCTGPDGRTVEGQAQVELPISGRYIPYGFE